MLLSDVLKHFALRLNPLPRSSRLLIGRDGWLDSFVGEINFRDSLRGAARLRVILFEVGQAAARRYDVPAFLRYEFAEAYSAVLREVVIDDCSELRGLG